MMKLVERYRKNYSNTWYLAEEPDSGICQLPDGGKAVTFYKKILNDLADPAVLVREIWLRDEDTVLATINFAYNYMKIGDKKYDLGEDMEDGDFVYFKRQKAMQSRFGLLQETIGVVFGAKMTDGREIIKEFSVIESRM